MMSSDVEAFLAPLESRTHADRVHVMIALGRQARHDHDAQELISELEDRGFFERYLALFSCYGSLDSAHALRALADKSAVIRGLAIRLVAILSDATQLATALHDFSRVRLALAWRLRQQQKTAVIDAFLDDPALAHDRQFYALLPLGSHAVVARHVTTFHLYASARDWSHLARFHPDIAVAVLDRWSQEIPYPQAVIVTFNLLLEPLQATQSERLVAITTRLLQHQALSDLRLQPLIARQPVAIVDIILAQKKAIPYAYNDGFAHVIASLRDDQIERLLALNEHAFGYNAAIWFARLPVQRRLALFSAVRHALQPRHDKFKASLPATVLELLPADQREQAAHAILNDPSLGDERLEYAYLLPWHEMLAFIADYLHKPVIEKRQMALRVMIDNVRFHRDHLADALARLRERRMEPDFMRRQIFANLCTLPRGLWRDEHLTDLAEIIQHGLRDVGLSQDTQKVMIQLLTQVLPRHVDWTLSQITLILRDRGFVSPKKVAFLLPTDEEAGLVAMLLPIMTIWRQQEKDTQILDAIDYYLPRGPLPGAIVSLLANVVRETATRATVARILMLVHRRNAAQFADLLATLLSEDASFITFDLVAEHLFYRRQDLVTPFLSFVTYQGRFATGRQRFLLRLTRRFAGGSTRQQAEYLAAVQTIITDDTADVRMLTNGIKQLAYLPATSVDVLNALAQQDNTLVRTTALFTLGRLDSDDGMPILIAALQDSRARIAINVLRPFLWRMPAAEALAILIAIPMNRVTVAKEVIRLIAGLDTDAALGELLAREQTTLHKDVRLVLIKELWRYRAAPEVLAVFTRVAQSPDAELAATAIPPYDALARVVRRWVRKLTDEYMQVVALLLQHPDRSIQEQAINVCQSLADRDMTGICVPPLFALLAARRGHACYGPAKALFLICTERDLPAIVALLQARLSDRATLENLVSAVNSVDGDDRPDFAMIYRLFLTELARDPVTVKLQIDLARAVLSREELIVFFTTLAANDTLHASALMKVPPLIDRSFTRFTTDDLAYLEGAFANSSDERLRYLALILLKEQADRAQMWSPAQRERLAHYRADVSLLVTSEAQFVFPGEDDA